MGFRFTSVFSDKGTDWHFTTSPRSYVLYDGNNNAILEIDKKSEEFYCIPGYKATKEGNIGVLMDEDADNVLGFIWYKTTK